MHANRWVGGLLALSFGLTAGAVAAESAGAGIAFYRLKVTCPTSNSEAVLRDILFYNGDQQVVMDARGQADYHTNALMACILAGDPETTVVLTAGLTRGKEKDISRYEWHLDRDDKPESTEKFLDHTFTTPGKYFVLLKVADRNGFAGFAQATVVVGSPDGRK